MKFRMLAATAILLAGVSANAKVVPSQPFFLDRDITVNGAKVPEGMYILKVETKGSSVDASLWKDGLFVASAHGTWVKHGVKYTENTVLLRVNPDGTRSLSEIRLAGNARTIVIDDASPFLRINPGARRGDSDSSTGT